MLRTAMGPAIAAALADPRVIEVMVNPDGALRLDRLGEGRVDTGVRSIPPRSSGSSAWSRAMRATEVHAAAPIVSAELPPHARAPASGSKACCRRSSLAPCFSIRKPAARIYTLDDYVDRRHHDRRRPRGCCSRAVVERRNILVAGGTSSGKTTLANALLAEMARLDERVILIEDTRELQCAGAATRSRCAPGRASRQHGRPGPLDAAAAARPHHRRRGARAPKRSTCSRPGTPAIPAGSPRSTPISAIAALYRLEQLVQEAVVTVPRRLIAEAIDIDRLHRRPRPRRAASRRSPASTGSIPTAATPRRPHPNPATSTEGE